MLILFMLLTSEAVFAQPGQRASTIVTLTCTFQGVHSRTGEPVKVDSVTVREGDVVPLPVPWPSEGSMFSFGRVRLGGRYTIELHAFGFHPKRLIIDVPTKAKHIPKCARNKGQRCLKFSGPVTFAPLNELMPAPNNCAHLLGEERYWCGVSFMQNWVAQAVMYPKILWEVKGQVVVAFAINEEGEVSDVKILESLHPTLDAEALKAVESIPTFAPGFKNGEPTKVYYTLPVDFK